MKRILLFFALLSYFSANAQVGMPVVRLPKHLTVHFISPEPIQYVDISGKEIIGDLPLKNVLRIRLKDSLSDFTQAVITIAGEKFIAQYRIAPGASSEALQINITPADCKPLDISGIGFSQNELKSIALRVLAEKPRGRREKASAFGMSAMLNHVYAAGDYIFLDISYKNSTRLKYDIDGFRFKVDDKKVVKASNVQSVDLKPEFMLTDAQVFSRTYRNVFVFRKLTFPGNKILHVELSEKQISGRVITLAISYKDILEADGVPN